MKYYWFIFCKTDLLLEKVGNNYTIPLSEEPPIALRPWTHVMNIGPTEDGTEVKAFMICFTGIRTQNSAVCVEHP